MSQSVSNILRGPARIFMGVTPPASGLPPTWADTLCTNGVPSTGTEVGFTSGPTEFIYKATLLTINPEQSYMAADVQTTDEVASVTFMCYEKVYQTLQQLFGAGAYAVNDGTRMAFAFGNGAGLVNPATTGVLFSAPQPHNAGKYTIGMLYKAYAPDGIKMPFDKSKPTIWQVTLSALADVTRTAGDHGGAFIVQT
jgi:hypothetical protein